MTEDEAKTKWCPFSRVVSATIGGESVRTSKARNRVVQAEAGQVHVIAESLMGAQCIASACMAWRWLPEPEDTRQYDLVSKATGERVSSGTTADTEWVLANPDEPLPVRGGYCGLAGAPR